MHLDRKLIITVHYIWEGWRHRLPIWSAQRNSVRFRLWRWWDREAEDSVILWRNIRRWFWIQNFFWNMEWKRTVKTASEGIWKWDWNSCRKRCEWEQCYRTNDIYRSSSGTQFMPGVEKRHHNLEWIRWFLLCRNTGKESVWSSGCSKSTQTGRIVLTNTLWKLIIKSCFKDSSHANVLNRKSKTPLVAWTFSVF